MLIAVSHMVVYTVVLLMLLLYIQNGSPLTTVTNESTEVHNPRRDCAILTLAHETHQTSTV